MTFAQRKSANTAQNTSRRELEKTSTGMAVRDLDSETEELSHARVSKEIRIALSQARVAKGLKQKDLATRLNLPIATVIDYENGKAIPNNALIARFEHELGTKLPRQPKKKKGNQ